VKEKADYSHDVQDFLLDDEFVRRVQDEFGSEEYITGLKAQFPTQESNIDLAIKVLEVMKNKQVYSTPEQRLRVWSEIEKSSVKSRNINLWNFTINSRFVRELIQVAAILIVTFVIGTLAFYYTGRKVVDNSPIISFASSTKVDYTKSQLILSDGKKIEVTAANSKISYSPDGASVNLNDSSSIVQDTRNDKFNQMIVPYGKYATLKLSDGTKVWLNAGSRLVYPPTFRGKYREVYLQGEGYFEVTKNTTKPFYVKTDRMKIEVLGTKFDVQAFSEEETHSAILLEGKISLSSPQTAMIAKEQVVLKQSERGVYSGISNRFIKEEISHPENFIDWTYGYINFNKEPLESVLKRISRYYNIKIQLRSGMGSFQISGKLDLKEDSERVLKGIAIISKMKLFKEEGGYLIKD
jgi:hypothetical protein